MKFLFVGTNPENTGAASHFVALARAMSEAGHEVSAVVSPQGLIGQGLADANVHLRQARFRNVLDLRGYAAVFAAARRSRPDWLVGNFGKEYWPLILIGRLLKVPVVLFRHRTPPMKRLSAFLLPRLAYRFFAVSDYARQAYLDRGIPAALVRVLHNPVDTASCRPDLQRSSAIRRQCGIPEEAIVLGYFGRIHQGKGILPLLDAANQAMLREPRLHCLWLGDGPDAALLRERIAASSVPERHHVAGWIDDVHPYYSALSFLAFPSIRPETFGRVSIEAQAAGVPVLGSDIGGVPETLHAGVTGMLLPPHDVAAWRDAILTMCDPAQRLPMAAACRDFVQQRFSTRVVAEDFVRDLNGEGGNAAALTGDFSHPAGGASPRATWRISGMRRTRR
ncbi:MAG: glycosyltransferase family 1 protein [Rhodanobacter sp.]|nr:MAG: glycosyltransferase family 1 protein [Rhodanobacter sp.]